MLYNKIVDLISKQLGDELVTESEMLGYMDRVIDDINARLNTTFPTFTEFKEDNAEIESTSLNYTAIPDKYIRTVVIPGAAFKFYTTDEEGGYSSPKYEEDYKQGMFYMERDFSFNVPERYRGDVEYGEDDYPSDEQGYLNIAGSDPGLIVSRRPGGFW